MIIPEKDSFSIIQKYSDLEFQKDLRVLSLFSGCGGMDLGFEGKFEVHEACINKNVHSDWVLNSTRTNWFKLPPTRFKTVFANDIRPGAQKVWRNFFSRNFNAKSEWFHLESIVEKVKRHWDNQDSFPKNIDVITGGFPCQDFSIAGKRKGFNSHKNHKGYLIEHPNEENRGKLYMWMREAIDIIQPKIFIAENVKGLISLGNTKEIIQSDFQNIGDNGYMVIDGRVLNAGEFGVPQARERVFFIGFKKGTLKQSALIALMKKNIPREYTPFPQATHSLVKSNNLSLLPSVPLRKIFEDLKEPNVTEDWDQKSFSKAKWYGKHCQGNREVDLDKIGPTIRAEHHGNIEFRRLSKKYGGKNELELNQGLKERRLTIRECCRIQTFPDNYKFTDKKRGQGVSTSEAYKLIGNAVPPLLAFHLAKRLEEIWPRLFKRVDIKNKYRKKEYLPQKMGKC